MFYKNGTKDKIYFFFLNKFDPLCFQVGSDIFAPVNIESMKQSGVITDYIEKDPVVNTATAMITVTSEGLCSSKTIVIYSYSKKRQTKQAP